MHSSPGDACCRGALGPGGGPLAGRSPAYAWSVVARLPVPAGRAAQPGVAGPFAGISGDALLVAGGSNFPDKKPWEGGKKVYLDEVYILEKDGGFHWYGAKTFRLPEKLAYGASVTTPQGILCIGGETSDGYSKKVFLMQWDPAARQLHYKDLPDLPVAMANAGAALIDHTVYVGGGENATRALAGFISLDLDDPARWRSLPDVPIAMSHSAMVAQSGMLYLIGGRSKTASGISTLHNTVFSYNPVRSTWRKLHPIGDGIHPPHLAAANAVADDNGGILVIGGDDGRIFHQLETLNAELATTPGEATLRHLRQQKLDILDVHPGFWRGILLCDPAQDRWTNLGQLPVPAPVTTTAVRWGDDIVIPCGEIKPGIRSADILLGTITSANP